VNKLKTEITR